MTIYDALKKYWNYDQFRPLQEDIIQSVLDGNDTLALLPTGGGKSICFQVPAIVMEGLCIVISPLIALMKDQVENLKKRGVMSEALYTGQSADEIERILSNCLHDERMKLLYVSPERLKSKPFLDILKQLPISMIAVDEAHCVSQWGYDFRPPYLEIADIRPLFPNAPVLALTATATPEVVIDIQRSLNFKKENLFQKSFKRDNLTYFVLKEADKFNRLIRIVTKNPGTGIVYVRSRRKTREIAEHLQRFNISANFYHAGLEPEERAKRQEAWMNNTTRVIVSTNAFGMGIDKPDVRWVVHWDIPDTLEAYFQEAGRGGRDLLPSIAILMYDDEDLKALQKSYDQNFPPLNELRNEYNNIANYYNIALGEGEGYSTLFRPFALAAHLKIDAFTLYAHLSLFEKAGLLMVSGEMRKRSLLKMTISNEKLYQFYKKYPEKEELVKSILRSYGGLFSDYVVIHEEGLADKLEIKLEEIVAELKSLHQAKIVSYIPKDNEDRILFMQDRIDENYLYFSPEVYKNRKKVAKKRLEAVQTFVENKKHCRSRVLLAYFGERKSAPCGTCDVCVHKHRNKVKSNKTHLIEQAIKPLLHLSPQEIITHLSQKFDEDEVIFVLRRFME